MSCEVCGSPDTRHAGTHEGTAIRVRVLWINPAERRIGLSARDGGDFTFGDDGDSESPFAVLRRPQEPE
jgi:hypothetical protein